MEVEPYGLFSRSFYKVVNLENYKSFYLPKGIFLNMVILNDSLYIPDKKQRSRITRGNSLEENMVIFESLKFTRYSLDDLYRYNDAIGFFTTIDFEYLKVNK